MALTRIVRYASTRTPHTRLCLPFFSRCTYVGLPPSVRIGTVSVTRCSVSYSGFVCFPFLSVFPFHSFVDCRSSFTSLSFNGLTFRVTILMFVCSHPAWNLSPVSFALWFFFFFFIAEPSRRLLSPSSRRCLLLSFPSFLGTGLLSRKFPDGWADMLAYGVGGTESHRSAGSRFRLPHVTSSPFSWLFLAPSFSFFPLMRGVLLCDPSWACSLHAALISWGRWLDPRPLAPCSTFPFRCLGTLLSSPSDFPSLFSPPRLSSLSHSLLQTREEGSHQIFDRNLFPSLFPSLNSFFPPFPVFHPFFFLLF